MDTAAVSFALAFGAGVASFLSPCVLPVVPGYVTFVTGITLEDVRSGQSSSVRRQAALHAAFFILGFATLFVLLGASATAIGGTARRLIPVMQQVGGAVIVLFGLYMLGVIRMPLLMRERRVQLRRKPAGMAGSMIAGVAFGAGWTPCIGPVLASILLYAGMSATVTRGIALLAVYALGLGLPFFIAAVAFNWFLARAAFLRKWLLPMERAAGVILIIVGALLFNGRFAALARWLAL